MKGDTTMETKAEKKNFQAEQQERIASATQTVKTILGMYPPNRDGSTPVPHVYPQQLNRDGSVPSIEYINSAIAAVNYYPIYIHEGLADIRTGLVAKCTNYPTIAEIIEMADQLWKKEDANAAQADRVVVLKDSPAWNAWQAKRGSTPCVTIFANGEHVGDGWYFPTEYPPEEAAKRIGAL